LAAEEKQAFFKGLFDGGSNEVCFERSGGFLKQLERIMEPVLVPSSKVQLKALPDENASVEETEQSAELNDESVATETAEQASPETVVVTSPISSDRIVSQLAVQPSDMQQLFSSVQVSLTDDGGMVFKAPRETAGQLAALFGGIAQMFRAGVG